MRTANRSNALLVELLIVVLFFMLSSTVLLQVFSKAHSLSARAEVTAQVVTDAQNVADQLYAAADAEALLKRLGFEQAEDAWRRAGDGYQTAVTLRSEHTAAGVLARHEIVIVSAAGEELLRLPCVRYQEAQP